MLQDAGNDYPRSLRAKIPLDRRWGCVISLNFDTAWRPNLTPSDFQPQEQTSISPKVSKSLESRRISWSVGLAKKEKRPGSSRIWFPNGTVLAPETIRMGLRDYGGAPRAIQSAFNWIKSWERTVDFSSMPPDDALRFINMTLEHASDPDSHSLFHEFFGQHCEDTKTPFPLSWVAEFLYRPLVFAGVGLSDQESGLWWLPAQRARNLARVTKPINGSVRILMRRNADGKGASQRDAFWATRPFGIEPVYCDDWDEGWERIVDKL